MRANDGQLRRHAVELVAQLPADVADARIVLAYARELIDTFLSQDAPGGRTPNLRAISNDRSPVAASVIQPGDRPGI